MSQKGVVVCMASGVVGSFCANLFGGWSKSFETLLILMIIDFITAVIVAAFFNKSPKSEHGGLASGAMGKGISKKFGMFIVIIIAHRLDVELSLNYLRNAVIIGYIVTDIVSILENVGLMGVTYPKILTQALDILKKKEEGNT